MIRGLYTAASGMMAMQDKQNIYTNNLANVNTIGYKSDQEVTRAFPEKLIQAINYGTGDVNSIGRMFQGVFVEESIPIFTQGTIVDSEINTNMAINDSQMAIDENTGQKPSLFFAVTNNSGNKLYTRSGLFVEDAAGQLVTPEGYLVLDDGGTPINIDGREFTVSSSGNITFAGDNSDSVQMQLTKVNNSNKMVKIGNQVFTISDESIIDNEFDVESERFQILQGKVESSNVDIDKTVVRMNTALNLYQANQQLLQTIDRTLDKAVNDVGKV